MIWRHFIGTWRAWQSRRWHGGVPWALLVWLVLGPAFPAAALERTNVTFPVFQFPPDRMPRVDGDASDWAMVPPAYRIGSDQLRDTVSNTPRDTNDLQVQVRVGWVSGMNQLWFLYEADDDYWDFSLRDLHNDIFELVVDADLSGGPLIPDLHPDWKTRPGGYQRFQGYHAQNYHIFTPWRDKEWAMVWGPQPWIKDRPYANAAQQFNFQPGGAGHYVLEFWITPFDYAPADGPERAVISRLRENQTIGLSWAVLDYDDVKKPSNKAFWNLSHKTTMYGNASDLCGFRLMPLEPAFRPELSADWTFRVLSEGDRRVSFEELAQGDVRRWEWDFGDGTRSEARSPVHVYQRPGHFTVTLSVTGPAGTRRHSKVWDISFRAAPVAP